MKDTFEDHYGPITAVSFNKTTESLDYNDKRDLSNLYLTSSFDSTVKLWDSSMIDCPIYSFESSTNDYIYDTSWSPIHPAMFASISGSGKLDIWNLNRNIEQPSVVYNYNNESHRDRDRDRDRDLYKSTTAFNKMKWSKSGNEIAVGDDNGCLNIFELNAKISMPNDDNIDEFVNKTLINLKQLNNEELLTNNNKSNEFFDLIR
jgi:dynein intermediate chain, cytosolic